MMNIDAEKVTITITVHSMRQLVDFTVKFCTEEEEPRGLLLRYYAYQQLVLLRLSYS